MNKQQITDWLTKILHAPDAPFSDVEQSGMGTLIVQTATGEQFTISAAPLEDGGDIAELQNCRNFIFIFIEMALMEMKKQNILSPSEYQELSARISEHATIV